MLLLLVVKETFQKGDDGGFDGAGHQEMQCNSSYEDSDDDEDDDEEEEDGATHQEMQSREDSELRGWRRHCPRQSCGEDG